VPYKDPEKRRVYNREYRAANLEFLKEYDRERSTTEKRRAGKIASNRKNAATARAWWAANPEKRADYEDERRRRHPHRFREYDTRRKEIWAGRHKPDLCEACGDKADSKAIHFDHCHSTGAFRGWICQHCNYVLGHVRDDPDRLRKLIAYLARTKEGTGAQLVLSGL
jgi:hypothetical protein